MWTYTDSGELGTQLLARRLALRGVAEGMTGRHLRQGHEAVLAWPEHGGSLGDYLVSRVDVLFMSWFFIPEVIGLWRFAQRLSDMAGQLSAGGLGIVSLPWLAMAKTAPPWNANWAGSSTAPPCLPSRSWASSPVTPSP